MNATAARNAGVQKETCELKDFDVRASHYLHNLR